MNNPETQDLTSPLWNCALLDAFGGQARAEFVSGQVIPSRYRDRLDRESVCSYHWNGNVHTYHYFKEVR
ncbi:hypothetical protein PMO31116_03541 [Pandoraea morbifera]|uniref:Uncharacterized protein n=1 Tax=Pandoraea morbifera TaxID=2508300 RepID=A0A5E4X063_9BURK|nr:hypothetical protein PMO31116_03541 [Pandoraea morbifera]